MKKIALVMLVTFFSILLNSMIISADSNISLTLNNPPPGIYNTKNIPINLSLDIDYKIDKIVYIDFSTRRPRPRTLCNGCYYYGLSRERIKRFKQGSHNLSFQAINDKQILAQYDVSFLVDSKSPRISVPRLSTKGFTNGSDLSVKYTEDNFANLSIFYKKRYHQNTYKIVSKVDCESGRNKICSFNIDISEYEDQEIEYKFLIKDIAGNTKMSKSSFAVVDTLPPEISDFSYSVDGRYIFFNIELYDKNFYKVLFIDYSAKRPRWRTLCSVLRSNKCEKKQRFQPGEHNITIMIADKAGNNELFYI